MNSWIGGNFNKFEVSDFLLMHVCEAARADKEYNYPFLVGGGRCK